MVTSICPSNPTTKPFVATSSPSIIMDEEHKHNCEEKQACDAKEEHHHQHIDDTTDDTKEQVQTLLQSLDILARLATMDTDKYQASLQRGQDQNGVCQLQKSLEVIQHHQQQRSRLDTKILQLSTAIHCFHSTIHNLQHDAEEHTVLYNNLAQQVRQYQTRNAKLERALSKVCAKNEKLAAKIKHRTQEKQSMVQQVQDYVQQVKDAKKEQSKLEEQNVVYQLHAHQHFLQQQPLRGRSVSADVLPSPMASPSRSRLAAVTRRRIWSQDAKTGSELLEEPFDALDPDTTNDSFLVEGLERFGRTTCTNSEPSIGGEADDSSVFSSTSSVSSLITDEGVATVRLGGSLRPQELSHLRASPVRGPLRLRTNSTDSNKQPFWSSTPWPSSKSKKMPPILTLTFPNASMVGLQFEKTALVEEEVEPHSKPPRPMKGLLTDAMLHHPHDDNAHDNATISATTTAATTTAATTTAATSGFHLNWSNVFGKSYNATDASEAKALADTSSLPVESSGESGSDLPLTEAFVVSGMDGFHDEWNERPTLGSRLVAICGEPVDPTWSLEELQLRIQKMSAQTVPSSKDGMDSEESKTPKSQNSRVLTLSFCDGHLSNNARKDQLKTAKRGVTLQCDETDDVKSVNPKHDAESDVSVSTKIASSFNFLKKSPAPAQTSGSTAKQVQEDTPVKSDTNKESSGSIMPKMSLLFSTKTKKVQDESHPIEEKKAFPQPPDQDEEVDFTTTNTSKDSKTASVMPKMSSFFGIKDSNTVQDCNGILSEENNTKGAQMEEKADGNATEARDEVSSGDLEEKKATDESHLSSTNFFQFFSPQKNPGEKAPEEPPCHKSGNSSQFVPAEGKQNQDTNESDPASSDGHTTEGKTKQLLEAPSIMPSEASQSKGGIDSRESESTPIVDDKKALGVTSDEVSAGDKFRSSMASMGKIFSKPFVQSMDSEDDSIL